ncbi:HEAT repeat domain-containing protein [Peptococcaceae bacterium 1198_IL3148]
MISKQDVSQLVLDGNHQQLIILAKLDTKRILRYLMRLTYATDELLRYRAIEALGLVAGVIAQNDPDTILDLIRRLIWSMNDESGAQSWSAPETIAEIIYNQPDMYHQFASVMIRASIDEEIFQQGMLWAVGRLSAKVDYIRKILPEMTSFLDHHKANLRGYAAWALGQAGASEALDKLRRLESDNHTVRIYIEGQMYQKTVGQLASESIAKIS